MVDLISWVMWMTKFHKNLVVLRTFLVCGKQPCGHSSLQQQMSHIGCVTTWQSFTYQLIGIS